MKTPAQIALMAKQNDEKRKLELEKLALEVSKLKTESTPQYYHESAELKTYNPGKFTQVMLISIVLMELITLICVCSFH